MSGIGQEPIISARLATVSGSPVRKPMPSGIMDYLYPRLRAPLSNRRLGQTRNVRTASVSVFLASTALRLAHLRHWRTPRRHHHHAATNPSNSHSVSRTKFDTSTTSAVLPKVRHLVRRNADRPTPHMIARLGRVICMWPTSTALAGVSSVCCRMLLGYRASSPEVCPWSKHIRAAPGNISTRQKAASFSLNA